MKNNVLIIHTAFPGDILLATPFFKAVADMLSPNNLTLLTTPVGLELCKNLSIFTQIVPFDKRGKDKGLRGYFNILKKLKHEHDTFDIAFVPHRFFKSASIAYLLNIPQRIGFYEKFSWSLTPRFYTEKIPRYIERHEIERNLSLLRNYTDINNLGALAKQYPVELPFSDLDKQTIKNKIQQVAAFDKKVIISPSSNWFTKAWPKEYFIKLLDMFQNTAVGVILVASNSKKDMSLCEYISQGSENKNILNLAGDTSFAELSALCSIADLMITNDSFPMHVGASHKIPLIAIFGPTTKQLGFYPYSEKSLVLEENIECRPCGLHGQKVCPKGHFKCMRDIEPQRVFNAAKKMLMLE